MRQSVSGLIAGVASALLVAGCSTSEGRVQQSELTGQSPSPTASAQPSTPENPEDTGTATDSSSPEQSASTFTPAGEPPATLGGPRPARYYLPGSYDPSQPMPVVLALHGYTSSADNLAAWWRLPQAAQEAGVLLITPEGTKDRAGDTFWNATDYCCNLYDSSVDDVAYLTGLVKEASKYFNIDPGHVSVIGHSNGGFMAERLACDSDLAPAAIVNVAGSGAATGTCTPTGSLSVLHVHGDQDEVINYNGLAGDYPSVEGLDRRWANRLGCDAKPQSGPTLNLVDWLPADETRSARRTCGDGQSVETWTLRDGNHSPDFNQQWAPSVFDWLATNGGI